MSAVKSAKYSLGLLLLLALLCLITLWLTISTTGGTKLLLTTTQHRLQNVSYTYESGNLLEGIVLTDALWKLKNGVTVSGENVNITANAACWQSKKLCIDSGTIDKLVISLPLKKSLSNEITLKSLSLLLSIKAKAISVQELIVAHPARPDIKFINAELKGSISDSNITLQQFHAQWNKLSLQGSGTLTMQNNYPINMHGTAWRKLGNSALLANWETNGNLKALNLKATFNKPFNAELSGELSLLDRRLPADLDFEWNSIALPFNRENPEVIATAGKVDIRGHWPHYNAKGSAQISGPNIPSGSADLSGKVSTTALYFEPLTINTLNGSIVSDGELSWKNDIRWRASINARNLEPEQQWPALNGKINVATALEGALTKTGTELRFNNIAGDGNINGYPLTTSGNITKNSDQRWHFNSLQLNSENNNISANGTVGDSLKLVFSLLSAETLLPGAMGNIHGDLTLTDDITNPTIEGSITTANFKYNNIDLKNAKISGIVRNLASAQSDVRFQAQAATVNNRLIKKPDLTFNGSLSDHYLRMELSSNPIDSVTLEILGSTDEHYNWNGRVNSVRSHLANRSLSLAKPFVATWINNNKTLAVEPHCWLYDFASVCVEESSLIGKTGIVQFGLNRLPLESIKEFVPNTIGLDGNLVANGNLTWGPNQKLSVTVDSYLENATAQIDKFINKNKVQMNFPVAKLNITTSGYRIYSNLYLESDKFSTFEATVAVNTSRNNLPIKGTVSLTEGQLSWIRDLLPDINLLDGKLNGEAQITGSLFEPVFTGDIRLQNGKVQSALLPIDIKNIDIGLNIHGTSADISGTGLANDRPITLKGTGSITADGFSSDLNLVGNDINITHRYAENAVLSPNLNFTIRPHKIDITGNVEVPSAQVTIQSLTSDGVALSDDVIVIEDTAVIEKQSAVGSTGINTKVNISLGNDVSVEAFGLNADLDGDFQFRLEAEKPPALAGTIGVSEGIYKAYGQTLKIRDGDITFTGPIEQTALSIEAVREIKGLLAGVRIGGTIKSPTTDLFSVPSIPEEDILPYLVLGRKLDFGESKDSDLLRKAALMLGVGSSRKVSSKLAANLGIDDFSLSAWGSGDDTEILLSGKLNDRLLLRYGLGVFNNSNSLYLRYDLTDHFYLETSSKGRLETAVDLFYSFDF